MLTLLSTSFVTDAAPLPPSVVKPPKWNRFDPLAKRCFHAAGAIFSRLPSNAVDLSRTAVVLCGREGSDATNAAYFKDYLDNGRQLGSSLLFRYTLPSCAPAEAAIAFGLQGPLFYERVPSFDFRRILDDAAAMAEAESLDAVLLMFQDGDAVAAWLLKVAAGPLAEKGGTAPLLRLPRIAAVVPCYNHSATLQEVVKGLQDLVSQIVVVDDGSSPPVDAGVLGPNVVLLRHEKNQGKGAALLTAFSYLDKAGCDWAVTLDADGQHNPANISAFVQAICLQPDPALWIGVRDFDAFSAGTVPAISRFGRTFSNFWVRLETGLALHDTQTGFRAYPVSICNRALPRCLSRRYDFEVESIVLLARGGIPVRELPVTVSYSEESVRASHFHHFRDNARLTCLHARLLLRRLLPFRDKPILPRMEEAAQLRARDWLFHPFRVLRHLVTDHASPFELAFSAFLGLFFGALPIPGVHLALIAYVTARLRMNQAVALSVQNLCMPPFVPALCIELGYWILHGRWLTDLAWTSRAAAYAARYGEWWLGACLLAPLLGILFALPIYLLARRFSSCRLH